MNNLAFLILIIVIFAIILTILAIVLTNYKHVNKVLFLCKRIVDYDKLIIENNTNLLDFIKNDLTFIRQNMIRRKNPIIDNH